MNTTNNPTELKRFRNNLRNAFAGSTFDSMAELARAAGVDITATRMSMSGKQYPNIITLTRICKALEISLDEVMKGVVEY